MLIKLLKKIVVRIFFISLIALSLSNNLPAANASPTVPNTMNRMIVFGDSLSDNGNLYTLTIQLHTFNPEVPIIPNDALYWNGRFTDGPVWNEYLAGMINFTPKQINPQRRNTDRYLNYAYGGSWAETDEPELTTNNKKHHFPPTLTAQVKQYLDTLKAIHPNNFAEIIAHDLIFIWSGGNDYLNQDFNGPPNIRSPRVSTASVIKSISATLDTLLAAGAKNLVLIGLPDLSKIPDISLRDPARQNLAPTLAKTSALHNHELSDLVKHLQHDHPEVRFVYLDTDKLFTQQFQQSKIRQQQYAMLHHGHYQRANAPCLIEEIDPDPTQIPQTHLSRVLALAKGPKSNQFLLRQFVNYPTCDLHRVNDKQSPFNYDQFYNAGGIFFDHMHPSTHIHAKIALELCKLLESQGYTFYQSRNNQYEPLVCHQFDLHGLLREVTSPLFPTE